MFAILLLFMAFQPQNLDLQVFLENSPITKSRSHLEEPWKLQIEEVQYLLELLQQVPATETVNVLEQMLALTANQADADPVTFDAYWLEKKIYDGEQTLTVTEVHYFLNALLAHEATSSELNQGIAMLAKNLPNPQQGFGQTEDPDPKHQTACTTCINGRANSGEYQGLYTCGEWRYESLRRCMDGDLNNTLKAILCTLSSYFAYQNCYNWAKEHCEQTGACQR